MTFEKNKRLIVLSSPSGGGKSTVARYLMRILPACKFSVSATTRKKRPREEDGVHYYFLSKEEFKKRINNDELVEYEEIFGNYYGTLKSEIDKALENKCVMLFDVDVKGALSLKKHYPKESLTIFLQPPDLKTLEDRLKRRETEDEEEIKRRLARAEMEIALKSEFDYIVTNINLEDTYRQIEEIVRKNVEL